MISALNSRKSSKKRKASVDDPAPLQQKARVAIEEPTGRHRPKPKAKKPTQPVPSGKGEDSDRGEGPSNTQEYVG